MIDIRKLKELVKLMVANDLSEMDLRDTDEQVTIRRHGDHVVAVPQVAQLAPAAVAAPPVAVGETPAASVEAATDGGIEIVSPMVAEALNTKDKVRLEELLKRSSLNLLLVSGLLFVLITTNLDDIYRLIELLNAQKGYAAGLPIILLISFSKLFSASLGCLNNIITNSEHYRYLLLFSINFR